MMPRLLPFVLLAAFGGCAHDDTSQPDRVPAPTTSAPAPQPAASSSTSSNVSRMVLGAQGEAPADSLSYVGGWRVLSFDGPKLGLDGAVVQADCGFVRAATVERDGERRAATMLLPCRPIPGVADVVERDEARRNMEAAVVAVALSSAMFLAATQPGVTGFPAIEEAEPREAAAPKPVLFLDQSTEETLAHLRDAHASAR